jgi:hypothetical protein
VLFLGFATARACRRANVASYALYDSRVTPTIVEQAVKHVATFLGDATLMLPPADAFIVSLVNKDWYRGLKMAELHCEIRVYPHVPQSASGSRWTTHISRILARWWRSL